MRVVTELVVSGNRCTYVIDSLQMGSCTSGSSLWWRWTDWTWCSTTPPSDTSLRKGNSSLRIQRTDSGSYERLSTYDSAVADLRAPRRPPQIFEIFPIYDQTIGRFGGWVEEDGHPFPFSDQHFLYFMLCFRKCGRSRTKFPGLHLWWIFGVVGANASRYKPTPLRNNIFSISYFVMEIWQDYVLVSSPTENLGSATVEVQCRLWESSYFCFSGSMDLSPLTHLLTLAQQSLESHWVLDLLNIFAIQFQYN